jgi:hypothetical protein
MTIFFAQYEAVPLPESEDFGECGGAYINCWLKANSAAEASELALALIHERRWRIVLVEEEIREVFKDLFSEDAEGRDCYQQAVTDGECYVFHRWPVETQ